MDEMNARLRALFEEVAEKKTTDFPQQDIKSERLEFLGLSGGHSPDKPRKRTNGVRLFDVTVCLKLDPDMSGT